MAQYIGIDKQRYDAGNKFLSQDPYLQNYQNKAAITFNPSRSNTGIMSQYPYPYPIIPQDDGGDGGGPPGPRGPGYGYTSLYDQSNKVQGPQTKEDFENYLNDIGVETITKEEEDFAKAQELKRGLVTVGKAAFFGPFEYAMGHGINKGIGFGINKAKDFFSGGDGDGIDINKDNVFTKESIDSYFSGEEGPTGGSTTDTRGGAPSHSTRDLMSYGGRAGYSGGGLTEYEVFKLRELGYNTKGGTVLEPFGGIKVLKDILRVNKYAYGGIVGLYR